MASPILKSTDYRNGISGVDRVGRRRCDNCGRIRKVNVYWRDTNKVLCRECSITGNNAFNFSVRGSSITPKKEDL